eukprot:Em0982g1a
MRKWMWAGTKVVVEGEDVVVKADKKSLESHKRTGICPFAPKDGEKTFLIIGGGDQFPFLLLLLNVPFPFSRTLDWNVPRPYGGRGLRESDPCFTENVLPYDRPKLSKSPPSWVPGHKTELEERKVTFADGESLSYGLTATGHRVQVSRHTTGTEGAIPGNEIAREATGKRVIVIGTSFIGMEATAYLAGKAAKIKCVDMISAPFVRVLGEKIGAMVQKMFEEKGVEFRLGSGVKEFKGNRWKGVVARDGLLEGLWSLHDQDGAHSLLTRLARRKFIHFCTQHSISPESSSWCVCSRRCGQFPLPLVAHDTNIGHWQVAHKHGNVLLPLNMLGKETSFDSIPFFWTVLFNKSLRYCGHALKWDEIIYNGRDDKVLAVCSLVLIRLWAQAAELMYQSKMPSGSLLKKNSALSSYL